MLKKTVNYTNYNGTNRTVELYFNMNKYELTQMMVGEKNVSFQDYLQQIIDTNDASEMVRLIKDILLMSYGEKSADGERFVKNEKLREDFENSAAFSELYMELAQNVNEAMQFVWGILPPDMRPSEETLRELASQQENADTPNLSVVTDATN